MDETAVKAIVEESFTPIKTMLMAAIDAVLPIAIPVFAVLLLILVGIIVFKDTISAALVRRQHFAEFDAEFDAYDKEFSRSDDLFAYLGIEDEDDADDEYR